MSKKQHPYPMYPAPIEVRYAARVMGRERNPYVSFESLLKHAGYLENGLAQLRPSTLYKGYKAKLAARETARQRLVVTAWEIEESERFTTFLDALHAENEERFGLADEELQSFRRFFSERDRVQVDDDRDYLQAIYEDECEILRVTSAQAEQISKILGSRVKDAFLQSGTAESQSRLSSPEIHDDEDNGHIILDDSPDLDSEEEECLGVGAGEPPHDVISSIIRMPFQSWSCNMHAAKCYADIYLYPPPLLRPQPLESRQYMPPKRAKGKTTIPKPTRGSGLNPSHLPAETQMHLSDEQPREPMANTFNPHEAFSSRNHSNLSLGTHAGYVPFNHDNYDNHPGPSSSTRPDPFLSARAGPSSIARADSRDSYTSFHHDNYNTYGSSSSSAHTNPYAGHVPFDHENCDTHSMSTDPSSSAYMGTAPNYQSLGHFGASHDIPPYRPSSSYGNSLSGHENAQSGYGNPYGSLESPYNNPNHPNELSDVDNMSGTAPNPHHIQVPPSFNNDETEPPPEPQRNPLPVTMGEIPESQVIHTLGPARSCDRRRTRRMPGTPYPTHQNPNPTHRNPEPTHQNPTDTAATTQATASRAEVAREQRYFEITGAVRDQIFERSKELVVGIVFTKDALASSTADQKRIVTSMIRKATPKFPGLDGIPRWKNQSKDITKIWRRVIVMRTVLTTLTREGVVMAYALFPPQGSQMPPKAFRCDRVGRLVQDNIFMHDGTLTIHAKFQNPFILYLVGKLTWNKRFRLDNLLTMPRKQLHYAMGLAGTITKCALLEQGHETLSATPRIFPGANSTTFDAICADMDSLSVEEKADLNQWKDHIVVCGASQQRVRAELSDFELDPDKDADSDISDAAV
ncbi:hypothetical protein F4604DRAFT_1683383 [Suillus subluteus]|nr:hypothetical protein F4604DRAFT_1683383 [Suillus subluteus]